MREARSSKKLSRLLYQLRTESNTPTGHALSIAVGTLIGSFPVYGFHLPICVVVGWVLRLNRVEMYLATNINNPFVAPFLVFIEVQLGSLVLRNQFHQLSLDAVRSIDLAAVLAEVVVGSVVLGLFLGTILGAATYRLARVVSGDEFGSLLIEETAQAYLPTGFLNWERVRARLRFDDIYLEIVRRRLFRANGTLVDASCGYGILLALMHVYRGFEPNRERPDGWPRSPKDLSLVGFLTDPRRARITREALGDGARVEQTDLAKATFPPCETFVLLDVLHRYSADQQLQILDRAANALTPSGTLIVRHRGLPGSAGLARIEKEIGKRGLIVTESIPSRVFLSRRGLLVARNDARRSLD